jgi:hypothetical protein
MDLFDKLFRKEGHPVDDVLVATLNRNITLATTPFDPELLSTGTTEYSERSRS